MSQNGFSLDLKVFNLGIIKAEKVTDDAAKKGLRAGGEEWKLDADNIPPRTPHLEGFLRGAGKVSRVLIEMGYLLITVSYDMPYAARWHEAEPGTVVWSEPGVGPKYLESKAARFMNKYIGIVSEFIRKALS